MWIDCSKCLSRRLCQPSYIPSASGALGQPTCVTVVTCERLRVEWAARKMLSYQPFLPPSFFPPFPFSFIRLLFSLFFPFSFLSMVAAPSLGPLSPLSPSLLSISAQITRAVYQSLSQQARGAGDQRLAGRARGKGHGS